MLLNTCVKTTDYTFEPQLNLIWFWWLLRVKWNVLSGWRFHKRQYSVWEIVGQTISRVIVRCSVELRSRNAYWLFSKHSVPKSHQSTLDALFTFSSNITQPELWEMIFQPSVDHIRRRHSMALINNGFDIKMILTEAIYLKVWSCFSFNTVRTRVGLPSDGPEVRLSRMLLCDPDSLPESVDQHKINAFYCQFFLWKFSWNCPPRNYRRELRNNF